MRIGIVVRLRCAVTRLVRDFIKELVRQGWHAGMSSIPITHFFKRTLFNLVYALSAEFSHTLHNAD